MRAIACIAVVLLLMVGCWAVWTFAPTLLAWTGLTELDVPARIVLVFAFLTVCEAALQRLAPSIPQPHPRGPAT